MKKQICVTPKEPLVLATTDIIYSSKKGWCNAKIVPLKLTLIKERHFFEYDNKELSHRPLIVFLCGGGWTEMDVNVWIPELAWYAKHGFAVASVEYPVAAGTRFPEQVLALAEAICFLRDHAEEYEIDATRIVLMGESAGGYLAALYAAMNGKLESMEGLIDPEKCRIDCAVAFYPPNNPSGKMAEESSFVSPDSKLPIDLFRFPSVTETADGSSAPLMIIHGLNDTLVPASEGTDIYDKWEELKITSDIILIEDAGHGDMRCVQSEIKEEILGFIAKAVF